MGQALIAFEKGLEDTGSEFEAFALKTSKTSTPLEEFLKITEKLENPTKSISGIVDVIYELDEAFEELKDSYDLSDSITSVDQLQDKVKTLNNIMKNLGHTDAIVAESLRGTIDADIKTTNHSLAVRTDILERQQELGKAISEDRKRELSNEIELLKVKKDKLEREKALQTALREKSILDNKELLQLQEKVHKESDVLGLKIQQLEAKSAELKAAGKDTRDLDAQIAKMKQQLDITVKSAEARKTQSMNLEHTSRVLSDMAKHLGSETDRVAVERTQLEIRKAKAELITNELDKRKELLDIAREEAALEGREAAAPFKDASNVLGSLQQLEGLSTLQSEGLNVAQSFTDVFAAAKESGQGFTEFLQGNTEAFADFSIALANSASSIYQQLSKEKVAAIDREIAAEQKRDGKSKESLAKIKKLQAKKIKEEANAQKAQLGMSTATGIMNIWAGPMGKYPPAAIAMTGMVAALGMKQLSNIDKAANGQLAALDSGGGGGMKITGGSRDNSIDVSKTASAGEYAFLSGGPGSFKGPGRSGGGTIGAGTSFVAGERGPEIVTPQVPVSVSDASDSGKGASLVFSPVFNAQAIDAAGMENLFQNYSRELYEGLERELNANNMTLEDLS
jgi:hypothetical protein